TFNWQYGSTVVPQLAHSASAKDGGASGWESARAERLGGIRVESLFLVVVSSATQYLDCFVGLCWPKIVRLPAAKLARRCARVSPNARSSWPPLVARFHSFALSESL